MFYVFVNGYKTSGYDTEDKAKRSASFILASYPAPMKKPKVEIVKLSA